MVLYKCVVIAGSGCKDKLSLPISASKAHIASNSQVQILAFSCGLVSGPGRTVSTDRKGGERPLTLVDNPRSDFQKLLSNLRLLGHTGPTSLGWQ